MINVALEEGNCKGSEARLLPLPSLAVAEPSPVGPGRAPLGCLGGAVYMPR